MKFYLFSITCLFFACNNTARQTNTHIPKGTFINASGYSRIITDLNADIHIEVNADSPYHCYLQCDKAIEPLIVFDITNDELHIGTKDNKTVNTNDPIVINMRVKELKSIKSNGSGKILVGGDLKTENFDVDNQGSSMIHVNNLQNNQVCINCNGSGEIILKGKTKNLIGKILGSGNIRAFGLETETTDAAITGSGNMEATVANTLDADITGSGNIYYKGKPSIRNSITGSGIVSAR